ncbi:hypothetical protein M702_06935 [Neisseria gonorrhoeae SK28355]|nr:hypothetical protein M680_04020 [Neisseria gonorrhoeae SK8976]KLR85469.1 hypothetical protein M684_07850 [Neisseria gonorrhoeae SK15454]KLR86107.1 hypothetical protein M675_08680 [Neisseria gonorrhoeae SK1902]KLR91272.1 hypothetical protein M702_06935 [Neisseria gonorrhoeae SK28355]KLR93781.1 hypothetical protein M678_09375 [Neisseria gonorrhoeae SK7461]KLR94650.1 hypothetical protein M685_01235 [Neisseria gonorrhoeae SK16259]KLS01488.1 hypothetical protein M683_03715 [Neisseria gonorrhoea
MNIFSGFAARLFKKYHFALKLYNKGKHLIAVSIP